MNWDKIFNLFTYSAKSPLIFNSGLFFVLFFIFYLIYVGMKEQKNFRTFYVIAFSLFFYYKSSGIYFILLIFSSFVDFYLGNKIHQTQAKSKRKLYLFASMIINLGMLGYFKYTNFFLENLSFLSGDNFEAANIFLPIGISFFTFQTMSYSIDLYRKEIEPAKSFWDFMFFVSFFPQLVAGPIVRAKDFIPQIYQRLSLTKNEMNRALLLIMGGLFKKAIISDYISTNFVDRVFDNPALYSGFENLMGVYGYAIQIYCDFSGYSDMAIGLALLMGFTLPINFDSPYQSASITEFWRRWHISLSSFLRDYLYIPLGGNRKGKIRTYINLAITMLLGGLWHGASWNFVLWGAMHGGILGVEKACKKWFRLPKNKFSRILGMVYTFHFVCFCWIFFRAADYDTAWQLIHRITSDFSFSHISNILVAYKNVFTLMLLGYLLHLMPAKVEDLAAKYFSHVPLPAKAFLLAACGWLVLQVASADVQPFIYFQF